MGRLIFFLKKNDSRIAIGLLILILCFLIIKGKNYSDKINKDGALCYGVISDEGKALTYYFYIDGELFKGKINSQNGKNKIGDTLIIQYSIRDPSIHIVHSKKGTKELEEIKKKMVRIWDAM